MPEYNVTELIQALTKSAELLDKFASKASTKESFSEDKLNKTAETLIKCGWLTPDEKEALIHNLRNDPDTALACVEKLAETAERQALVTAPLGEQVEDKKTPVKPVERIDYHKVAEERWKAATKQWR